MTSFKTRLIFTFSALLVCILCVISIVMSIYQYDLLYEQSKHSLYSLLEHADASYDQYKRGIRIRVSDWASDGYIKETAERLLNAQGQQKNVLAAELSDYFRLKKMPLDPTVVMLEVLDQDGIVIASSRPKRHGEDESDEKIRFREAIESSGNEVFIESVVFEEDEDPKNPMTHVTIRLLSLSSTPQLPVPLQAVLFFHFNNTKQIKSILTGNYFEQKDVKGTGLLEFYKTSDIYLVNRDYLMVTFSRFVEDAVLRQRVDSASARACFEQGIDFVGEYTNYLGKKVLGAGECVDGDRNVIIIEVEKQEAMSPIKGVLVRLMLITILIGILGIGGVVLLSNNLIKETLTFTEMVKKIAETKNFSTRITAKFSDEIQVITNAFNFLFDALAAYQKDVSESETKLETTNKTLQEKMVEVERMNKLMVGRELKMVELKKEIAKLKFGIEKKRPGKQ